jgi:inner membrane protein
MIRGVLNERQARRRSAESEVTATWGQAQFMAGPILMVPYRYRFETWKDEIVDGRPLRTKVMETAVAHAYFLPDRLEVRGHLDPSVLHRGIYDVVVYRGQAEVTGAFPKPDLSAWKAAPDDILWEDARVSFSISDLRGAREALTLTLAGRDVPLTPGTGIPGLPQGVQGAAGDALEEAGALEFSLALDFNGSGGISFAPLGKQTSVRLASTWPDPKFGGGYLPAERSVTPDGFEAEWNVSFYGRSYPQAWSSRNQGSAPFSEVQGSAFGVDLIQMVDSYRSVERSMKYGILVIVLVFTAFFLFEVRSPVRIHPIQYLLVGFALCLFYLALLSLSEFVSFAAAYLVGVLAATVMVALYSGKALRGRRRAALIAAELLATYLFLFVILRARDYALLLGTVALFVALAAVMYLTRNINWYARDGEEEDPS